MFEIVRRFYSKGLYDNYDLAKFVITGKITPKEYERITDQPYIEQ